MEEESGKSPRGPGPWGFGALLGLIAGTFAYIPLANMLGATLGLDLPTAENPNVPISALHWAVWAVALLIVLLPGVAMLAAPRSRRVGVGYLLMTLLAGAIAAYALISGLGTVAAAMALAVLR